MLIVSGTLNIVIPLPPLPPLVPPMPAPPPPPPPATTRYSIVKLAGLLLAGKIPV